MKNIPVVFNMQSDSGNSVPNQFIITIGKTVIFQSYDSIIAITEPNKKTILGKNWNYSRTTAKYRSRFLGETTKETEQNIKNGEYIVSSKF